MDLSKKYYIWFTTVVPRAYSIEKIVDTDPVKDYELREGEPLMKKWPKTAACEMIDGDPKHPVLADNILNTDQQIIISGRLKGALEKIGITDVEFLPVTLKEGKKKFDAEFYIAHLINLPDCLDIKASKAERSKIDLDKVRSIKKLELSSDPNKNIFRPSNYGKVTIVSRELAKALSEEGFSGLGWHALYDHPEEYDGKKHAPERDEARAFTEKMSKAEPIALGGKVSEQKKPFMEAPKKEIKQWIEGLEKGVEVNGQDFVPEQEEDTWLDAYNNSPDSWPGFDPKQYYCLGSNGESDYWLLDLANGAVVYYTHEIGYNRKNFDKVAKGLAEFKKLVSQPKIRESSR